MRTSRRSPLLSWKIGRSEGPGESDKGQGLLGRDRPVGGRRGGEQRQVGGPAHQDEIEDGEIEGRGMLLGNEGQATGPLGVAEGFGGRLRR